MDRFGARSLDEVLATIAVPGTDPDAVSEYVIGRLTARRRNSRTLVALAAILVLLAGGTAFALSGGEDPDEVVAPATESGDDASGEEPGSEVPEAGTGSVVTAVPTTVPVTIPLPTTTFPSIAGVSSNIPSYSAPSGSSSPGPGPGATPVPTTSATTIPPDASLMAEFESLATETFSVGDVVTVNLFWSDPDLPEGTAANARLLEFGGSGPLATVDGACTGGTGAGGIVASKLRFAEAKIHTVAVEISTCGGTTQTFATEVSVGPIADGFIPLMVILPTGVNPEIGSWTFIPDGGSPMPIRGDDNGNDSGVRMFEGAVPVTVLALPAPAAKGTITHAGEDCSRQATIEEATAVVTLGKCP